MLVVRSRGWSSRRLTSAAVVAGLHGVVLSTALMVDLRRAPEPAPRPIEVRLLDAPGRRAAAPPEPSLLPALQARAPLAVPPLPDIAIQAAPLPASKPASDASAERAQRLSVETASDSAAAAGEAAQASPEYVQLVQYEHFEPPVYPPLSRRLGEQGLVVVRVHIDETGRPVDVAVSVSSGFPRLDEAAMRAVRAARFRPHVEGNRARAAYALVPIRFELS